MKRVTTILAVAGIFIISARGQDFTNLNFESATNLPGNPGEGELVPTMSALPDWAAWDGTVGSGAVLSSIFYVSNFISGTQASVGLESGSLALSGDDSVGLFLNGGISQTGLVPDNAESLEFEASGGPFPEPAGFSVSLGGQTLSLSVLSQDPDYDVYGANIPTDMDGDLEALIFSCEGVGSGGVLLDDIDFSSSPVPEPSEYALMGMGAILFGFWRRHRKQT